MSSAKRQTTFSTKAKDTFQIWVRGSDSPVAAFGIATTHHSTNEAQLLIISTFKKKMADLLLFNIVKKNKEKTADVLKKEPPPHFEALALKYIPGEVQWVNWVKPAGESPPPLASSSPERKKRGGKKRRGWL